jgi:bile acid:Na+ symporter, BASS family
LTAFSSLITVFTIPVLGNLAYQHFIGQTAAIALPIGATILRIFLMMLLPIGLGMGFRQIFPEAARRLEKITNRLAVVLLNTISMLAGFYVSKLFKLNPPQQICIAIEVGIQSGTLAIARAVWSIKLGL